MPKPHFKLVLNMQALKNIEKIKGGWAEVDVIIATPDTMGELGKLGRVLRS
jgi:ribosomal protein L1